MRRDGDMLTAGGFLDCRFDLPESGQWTELEDGQLVHYQPPDLDHGNTVLNLSKLLAEHAQAGAGYPCFDLGLMIGQDPDTVWFPAVSYFVEGRRFAETDKVISDTVPELVVELSSTSDRRRRIAERVARYLDWGVATVWVIDPAERTLQAKFRDKPHNSVHLTAEMTLEGLGIGGLRFGVDQLFAEPEWWS